VPFSNFRFSNRGSVLGGEGNCPRGMSGGNVWRGNVLHSVDRRRTIVTPAPVNLSTNDTEWPKKTMPLFGLLTSLKRLNPLDYC